MKKHRILMVAVCLIAVLSLALTFSGCSDKTTFKSFVKFKESDVEKVELMSEYGVIKEVAAKDVFAAFRDVNFIKTEQEKFESDWHVGDVMTVNFYFKDKIGYYSIVLDIGARAMDGYNYKGKTGFYTVDNMPTLLEQLNKLFFAK